MHKRGTVSIFRLQVEHSFLYAEEESLQHDWKRVHTSVWHITIFPSSGCDFVSSKITAFLHF